MFLSMNFSSWFWWSTFWEGEYVDIDTPSNLFYQINTVGRNPRKPPPKFSPKNPNLTTAPKKYTGPVYLPPHIYTLLDNNMKELLHNYNDDAMAKYKASNPAWKANLHYTSDDISSEPAAEEPPNEPTKSPSDVPDTPSPEFDYDLMLHAYQHQQYSDQHAGEYSISTLNTT